MMSEEQTSPKVEGTPSTTGEAWQEVGKQFQLLGESIAATFRTAWQSEENRRRAKEMQSGLEAMITEIGQAIKDSTSSPEAQKARGEVDKTVESVRAASEQTVQEVRPHLVSALRQVNDELQKLIGRLEQEKAPVTEGQPDKPPVVDSK
jgi:hypothetical protein